MWQVRKAVEGVCNRRAGPAEAAVDVAAAGNTEEQRSEDGRHAVRFKALDSNGVYVLLLNPPMIVERGPGCECDASHDS
ncbi:hypothetical protein FACS189472_12520 [Alphaproteobacteria bacterium]|nr:hypothetical protein FACS189472_12520 [Alphaproteobacteria bacterium]